MVKSQQLSRGLYGFVKFNKSLGVGLMVKAEETPGMGGLKWQCSANC